MVELEFGLRGVSLDNDKRGINEIASYDLLAMKNMNLSERERQEIEQKIAEVEEYVLLHASNLVEYFQLMRDNGIPLENDEMPLKMKDLGRSGTVILTNYGTISTTETIPESIKAEIETMRIDSPDVMNEIARALKSQEIDYTSTYAIGREDYATGQFEVEKENPEIGDRTLADSASGRKEATRDIEEGIKPNTTLGDEKQIEELAKMNPIDLDNYLERFDEETRTELRIRIREEQERNYNKEYSRDSSRDGGPELA